MYAVTRLNGVEMHRCDLENKDRNCEGQKLSACLLQMHSECNRFMTRKCMENAAEDPESRQGAVGEGSKRIKTDDTNGEFFDEVSE